MVPSLGKKSSNPSYLPASEADLPMTGSLVPGAGRTFSEMPIPLTSPGAARKRLSPPTPNLSSWHPAPENTTHKDCPFARSRHCVWGRFLEEAFELQLLSAMLLARCLILSSTGNSGGLLILNLCTLHPRKEAVSIFMRSANLRRVLEPACSFLNKLHF